MPEATMNLERLSRKAPRGSGITCVQGDQRRTIERLAARGARRAIERQ
jgi:hypothetical protein